MKAQRGEGSGEGEGGGQSGGSSGGPLAGTLTRVSDWDSEILWSPSWTPKMTKAVPSTFFPYKNLCGEERVRFSPPEKLRLPPDSTGHGGDSGSPATHLTFTWPLLSPSPGLSPDP